MAKASKKAKVPKKGGAITPTTTTTTPATSTTTPATSTTTTPGSSITPPSIKSKDKRILQEAKTESKLSYYIMVDLVLSPGSKINLIQKASMGCTMQMDKIMKSLNETFGYVYTPLPLFTDYDVSKHDENTSKLSKSQEFERPYDENFAQKMQQQREKEIGALISENQRSKQELAVNRALLNNAQTSRRSLF